LVIRRRHVLFLAGFDPIDVPSQHRRIQREAAKFANTWSVAADVGPLEPASDGAGQRWRVAVRGPDWTTETTYEPLDWHHVVVAELARSRLHLLFGGLIAFLDFVLSGTAWRYFVATWRYALFFLVPFLNLLLFTCVALATGWFAAGLVRTTGATAVAVAIVIALPLFLILMRWPGGRWRVEQALADWIFARDYMYDRRGDFDALLDRFADRLIAGAQRAEYDELIVVGHSLGATLAVDVIARALDRDPDFAQRGPAICLLTVGSTIPKLALHPAASRLRMCIARVADHPDIAWTEYQARRDPISFYRFNPVTLAPYDPRRDTKPRIALVGLKDMLAPDNYQRLKSNHMRLHYQFVMGNEQRAIYDYFMLIAGPAPFGFLSDVPRGALDVFGDDGAYRMRPPAAAQGRAS
jgi:pimeloyl-ACP methyl ester carboxylesterase